jgi:hypothetical protein
MTAVTSDQGPQACGRFEWERIVRRLELPMRLKFTAMMVATYADADGSRVRPGVEVLASVTAQGASTVRKHLSALQEYGLLALVSRGGGRAGRGKAAEYQLTVPVDLLERVPMLPMGERRLSAVPDSPLAQGSAESAGGTVSPLSQGSGETSESPVDNSPTPVESTVDNPESPLAQQSTQSEDSTPNDRSENTVTERLSARFSRLTAPSSERLPSTSPTTKTTTTTPDPTQPPTARASPTDNRCPVCRQPHAFLDPCRPTGGEP